MLTPNMPYRQVYVNSDCDSSGRIYLNSTWGFTPGSILTLAGTGLSSTTCKVVDVQPSYIQVTAGNVAGLSTSPLDVSSFTFAKSAQVTQAIQKFPEATGFHGHIDPAQRCTLALLNAPLHYLGTVPSTGTAKSNNDVPFWNTLQGLAELTVTVIPDAACYIRPTTSTANLADSTFELLQAGEKRTIFMGPSQKWISVIGVGNASVNLRVYRNYLG